MVLASRQEAGNEKGGDGRKKRHDLIKGASIHGTKVQEGIEAPGEQRGVGLAGKWASPQGKKGWRGTEEKYPYSKERDLLPRVNMSS